MWLLFNRKLQQKWEYVVDNIIFGTSFPINVWQSLETHFNVYYLFVSFLVVNKNKKWKSVVGQYHILYVLPDKPMKILENTFKCKLFIWLHFNRKLEQKWEYVVYNIIFGAFYPINLWKSLKTHFYVNY